MIRIINETKKDRKGIERDHSLWLARVDANNLALGRGEEDDLKYIAYFGDVRTAFKRALSYAIKDSETALTLDYIIETVQKFDKIIETFNVDDLRYDKKEK